MDKLHAARIARATQERPQPPACREGTPRNSQPQCSALLAALLALLPVAQTSLAQLTSSTVTLNGTNITSFTGGSGTWTIPAGISNVEVLVVGGGGGGGWNGGGGGGGGGVLYSNGFAVVGGSSYTVTVGTGGSAHPDDTSNPTKGGNSVFGILTALGGGGGSSRDAGGAAASGGSGGGGAGATAQSRTIAGAGTSGQGNSGGNGVWPDAGVNSAGGGGGGAGGAGIAGTSQHGGNGGIGVAYSISGSTVYYGGGGGGGRVVNGSSGAGGLGGGAAGGGGAGTPNTGGGGGGGGPDKSGIGGSGIVIVRYPYAGPLSMTLVSPTNNQAFGSTVSISATCGVLGGTPPYAVAFCTNSTVAWTRNNSAARSYTAQLGMPMGVHTIYATVTDSATPIPATAFSATNTFTVMLDTNAPTPNPMTFAVAPAANGSNRVTMTATTAADLTPPVQYFFTNLITGAASDWTTSTVWTDTSITPGSTYCYRVKARDARSNETAWSGVACAAVVLSAQVMQDFESVLAGSSSPPAGWSVVTVPGQSGTYTATASALGSNGAGGSGGLGGQLASSYAAFPGVYLVNSGFPNGLDVRWAITGSYDLNMAGNSYGSCAFLFGDIASALPGAAGSLLEIVNKQSVFNNDPDQIINGAGTALVTRPADSQRCNAGTWYRVSFTWTPTSGTTGNLSYMVNSYSGGAWKPYYGASVSGFTFAQPQAYFGFGSLRAPSTIFDNLNITGTAYGTSFDSDGDGMPDTWETAHGLNPYDPGDPSLDPDGDGLTNLQEYLHGTDPHNADTDGDGLSDGAEVNTYHTDPTKADSDGDGLSDGYEVNTSHTNPLLADTDGDGLSDGDEVNVYHTNPLNSDTDGDGVGDWYELFAVYTSPTNAADKPSIPYPLPKPDGSTGATNKPVKVFILSGQSNMVGMGDVNPAGTPGTLTTVVKQQNKFPNLLDTNGNWSVRNDVYYRGVISAIGNGPLTVGQGSASTAIGPELGFGHVMGWYFDEPVLLIKSSIGNRALGWDFLPPGSPEVQYNGYTYAGYGESPDKWVTGTTPTPINWCAGFQYDQCFLAEADMSPLAASLGAGGFNVTDVLDNFATQYPQWAAQGFEIAGYVWWQGNRDIGTGRPYTDHYETNMVQFIKQLRAYYANRYPGKCGTNTPFVLATGCGDPQTSGNGLVVANAQLAVSGERGKYPEFAGNVKTMDIRGYWRDASVSPNSSQGYHYYRNAETYVLTGDALGRGMLSLLSAATTNDYSAWTTKYPSANLTDPNADCDGDGLSNDYERIWGLDPTSAASRNSFASTSGLKSGVFSYTRRAQALTGLNYTVWTSTDLATWTQDTGALQTAGSPMNDVETVTVTLSPSRLNGQQLFVRLCTGP